nr:hypothetical protein [Tanacetum cinerariifolium]
AQKEALDESAGLQKGFDEMIEQRSDRILYYLDRKWVPLKGDQTETPEWKWERITMDFVTKLPRTSSGHDIIWVIVDRLTKSAHKMARLARLYLNEIVDIHGVPVWIISDRDSHFTSRVAVNAGGIKNSFRHEGSWDVYLFLVDFSHNNSYHSSVRCAMFESLYGVVRFGKKGKLAPKFVGPFEIIEKVGPMAYKLDLPEELDGVHDTFHMLNLKKCLADPTLEVPLDEIQVDAKLNFVEELVKILEKVFKKLKRSRISIVKIQWKFKTWT